jgi:uncharacterized protein YyaL (SSP411 family)
LKDGALPNRLAEESSPYLLQHAGNPVDWYAWGPEALARAKAEDKPIFLSVGYSACHWCHVMERESFVDPGTAEFLNAHYVCIKVDREERPDLDAIYMQAVVTLTGRGGWPLSVWLDPETVPFYGGTYFPPDPRPGMPSFRQVLAAIAGAWIDRRGELRKGTAAMLKQLEREQAGPELDDPLAAFPQAVFAQADESLRASFDPVNGGWGEAPKFPQPLVLEYLLFRQALAGKAEPEPEVRSTLDAMAAGGIYDHLGGGFHRYAVDERWLVPHFEKMLYDNAQLARCYLHAWQLSGRPRYRAVAEETLDYLLRRMSHPSGAFFSSEDADSEGREGAFYLWKLEEVRAALDAREADEFIETYGLTPAGDFEGANILHLDAGLESGAAPSSGVGLPAARAKLLADRERRVPPARDEKIVAGWNGLALAALAEAARALPSERYRAAAEKTGRFFAEHLMIAGHRLRHSWKDGRASGNGFLEDYAGAVDGFLALYQCTFADEWFEAARGLTDALIEHFYRPEGGFYDTSDDHETLIVRPRSLQDSPTASGNSLAATVLLKMASYTGESRYRDLADRTLAAEPAYVARAPMMFGAWLQAHLLAQTGPVEVAVVGDPAAEETHELLAVLGEQFRPHLVAAVRAAGCASTNPLLEGREPDGGLKAAAWVCSRSTCAAPTGDPKRLRALLLP